MFILEELFCSLDDFCLDFEPIWRKQRIRSGLSCRLRRSKLSLSEIMTILISFDSSDCRTFKAFYLNIVSTYWRQEFPNLISYSRFVEWIPSTVIPLMVYLRCLRRARSAIANGYFYRNWIH